MSGEKKTVGVIGGLGPDSTLRFYERVLAMTPATRDQDHLHLIIDSNGGVLDRNAYARGEGASPLPELQEMARRLEQAGAGFLVMPCNTAHSFLQEIRQCIDIPVMDMIGETVSKTHATIGEAAKAGLLATSTLLTGELYQDALERHGLTCLVPDESDIERLMAWIYSVKEGESGAEMKQEIIDLGKTLIEAGADAIVAGCTEIGIFAQETDFGVPFIDSNEVLAEATVATALGRRDALLKEY